MIVRIKLGHGRFPRKTPGKNRNVALACAALLVPAALMAYVLGFWRLASDMGLTSQFAFAGLFSHWQVWIAIAAALHIAATVLNRYGRGGAFHLPRVLLIHFGAAGPTADDSPHPGIPPRDGSRAKAS